MVLSNVASNTNMSLSMLCTTEEQNTCQKQQDLQTYLKMAPRAAHCAAVCSWLRMYSLKLLTCLSAFGGKRVLNIHSYD